MIDDDAPVAAAYRRLLASEHEVIVVDSGRAALDLLAAGNTFDAILCDLMMPELSGMQLHAALAARDPALLGRLIFVTGGAFTQEAEAFLATVSSPRLFKPIDAAELRAVVRAVLG